MSLWKIEPDCVCKIDFKLPYVEIETQLLIFCSYDSAGTVSCLSAKTASHLQPVLIINHCLPLASLQVIENALNNVKRNIGGLISGGSESRLNAPYPWNKLGCIMCHLTKLSTGYITLPSWSLCEKSVSLMSEHIEYYKRGQRAYFQTVPVRRLP